MAHGYSTDGGWFIDPQGRHTLLRGVNLGGSTKVPFTPDGATHLGIPIEGWQDVSFVGRPAPLDEVDEHLDRIAHWGFNVLRFLTTWEAIEHAGPGAYDEAYLDYVREVVRRAGQRDLLVFVDPHHDVWSRWTGGDGAPLWAFDGAGLLPDRFVPAQAVKLDDFDWPSNYNRVPVATMWTLFFGGARYCPSLASMQDELQSHYIAAVCALAERLVDLDNVVGYDSLNEPSYGYLGRGEDLTRGGRTFDRGDDALRPFSPLEYLAAGAGVTVRHDDGGVLNPDAIEIWRDGCPWQAAGVWDLDAEGQPVLTAPEHFTRIDDRALRPFADLVVPFVDRFRTAVRAVHPDAIIFVEGAPTDFELGWDDPDPLVCNARHWYDITMLASRRFDPDEYHAWFTPEPLRGVAEIADYYAKQIGGFADHGRQVMSGRPMLLGEFGVTYDVNGDELLHTGDFGPLAVALEAMYRALDRTSTHSTQWNYTADNDHAHGDQWNDEDLSIYSAEDAARAPDHYGPLDRGGRGVEGFCRPRLLHAAGHPRHMAFDSATRVYELVIEGAAALDAPTEVYVPRLHYPGGAEVLVSAGEASLDLDRQRVVWRHTGATGELRLEVRPA